VQPFRSTVAYSSASLQVTFDDCFTMAIAPVFEYLLENPSLKTTVVLVPSLEDAHHTFCFPQPAFAKRHITCVRLPASPPVHVAVAAAVVAAAALLLLLEFLFLLI
jgi:hypothetical protein